MIVCLQNLLSQHVCPSITNLILLYSSIEIFWIITFNLGRISVISIPRRFEMSGDDDILELDSNGEFVVPNLPVKTKNLDEVSPDNTQEENEMLEQIKKSAGSNGNSMLSSIAAGEYKVFQYDAKVDVIIRLDGDEATVSSVSGT